MKTHLTLKSTNAKTGPIPVSTSNQATCPDACPLKSHGCYAASGPLLLHWRKVSSGARGMLWRAFLAAIRALPTGQIWRHNQAGDLAGIGDTLDVPALAQLVAANKGRRGFTYTHKPLRTARERDAIRIANRQGFTVNLSANDLTHADTLADLGIGPVVSLVPQSHPIHSRTPNGRAVLVCPAQYLDGITCESCQICSLPTRKSIVAFRSHGSGAKHVDQIAGKGLA